MKTASNIALLAPVPIEHLISGKEVCGREGKIAFGSNVFELFRELDNERAGLEVDVFFYASKSGAVDQTVSWHGVYVGNVESIGGAHPDGMRFRPPTTARYPEDNSGHWGIFYEVRELKELGDDDRLAVSDLTGYGKGRRYKDDFPPRRPYLIEHPK